MILKLSSVRQDSRVLMVNSAFSFTRSTSISTDCTAVDKWLVWGRISFNTDIPKRKSKLHTERSKLVASVLVFESVSKEISFKLFTIVSSSASTAFLAASCAVHLVLEQLFRVLTKSELLSPCFMNMAWRFGLDFKETVERLNCPQNILKDGDLTDTIFGDEVQNVSITMDILTSLRTLSESHCDTLKKNTI